MAKTNIIDFAAYKKRREKEVQICTPAIQPQSLPNQHEPGFTREQAIRQIEHATRMRQAMIECSDE